MAGGHGPSPDGQRLERREEATGGGAGPSRMAAAAHRGCDGRAPRDGERVPQGGRCRGAAAARLGPPAGKTGQRDVHRPRHRSKSGQRPVHRPRPGLKTGQRGVHRPRLAAAARPGAGGERVRALPRVHRGRARLRPQRDGDLAGPRRRPRLRRPVRQREALRREAEDDGGAGRRTRRSSRRQARRRRSTTARGRWCATPRRGSTGARGCS